MSHPKVELIWNYFPVREVFWLPIRLLMNLPFLPIWVFQLPLQLFWNFWPNAYVLLWTGIFSFFAFLAALIIVPSYALFVAASLAFVGLGGITFPVIALLIILILFAWAFWELGVYIDEAINGVEEGNLVEILEEIIAYFDVKATGNEDLVD